MGAIALRIIEPADGTAYAGNGNVHFRGAVDTAPLPAPLFYKWYSSLDPSGNPISTGAPNALDFTRALAVGTHVITLSATDVPGSDPASLKSVKHGGMTGGPQPPAPCRIDVLLAEILAPAASANLNRARVELVARAPQQWGAPAPNRLQYRWRFDPSGAPPGRAPVSFAPSHAYAAANDALPGKPPTLTYAGPAPAGLALGAYSLTLRVELAANPGTGHEASRPVTFTA